MRVSKGRGQRAGGRRGGEEGEKDEGVWEEVGDGEGERRSWVANWTRAAAIEDKR